MRKYKHGELWIHTCIDHTPHRRPTLCNSSCMLEPLWESSMCNSNILALLERRDYQTIETGKAENGYLASCFTKAGSVPSVWARSAKHPVPRAAQCISMTTMFVHMALPFWPILSIQRLHLLCPPPNDTDYIRKMIVWKLYIVVYIVIGALAIYTA